MSGKFHLSEFDIEILDILSKAYLTANMLFELVPTFKAPKTIKAKAWFKQRLKQLYDQGLINRDFKFSRGLGANEYYLN